MTVERRTVPELLAPAGGPAELRAALAAGADSVYLGLKRFSMRARAANFSLPELRTATELAHRAGVRIYLTINTVVFDAEWNDLATTVHEALRAGVDAFIVADLGLMRFIRRRFPHAEIHASTQATVHHPRQLDVMAAEGVSRIVVARELSLEELTSLVHRGRDMGMEIESFVHGALCVSWAGQCYAGALLDDRSANRGACPQLCRLRYRSSSSGSSGRSLHDHPLSLKDLCTLPRVHDLVATGVGCLKIEGRLKGPEYVYEVTRIYRLALDALANGESLSLSELQSALDAAFNRGFTTGGCGQALKLSATTKGSPNRKLSQLGWVREVDERRMKLRPELVPKAPPVEPGARIVFRDAEGRDGASGFVTKLFPDRWWGIRGLSAVEMQGLVGARILLGPDSEQQEQIRRVVQVWNPPDLPVRLRLSMTKERRLRVTMTTTGGVQASEDSRMPLEPARSSSLEQSVAALHLGRLGGSGYRLAAIDVDLPARLFLPPSELNRIRRALVAQIDRSRETASGDRPVEPICVGGSDQLEGKVWDTALSAAVDRLELVETALEAGVRRLLLPPDDRLWSRRVQDVERWLLTPPITPGSSFDAIVGRIRELRSEVSGVIAGNSAVGRWCHEQGIAFWADHSWNVTNDLAAQVVLDAGAQGLTRSLEAPLPAAPCLYPTEVVVAGPAPLMMVSLADLASRCSQLQDAHGRLMAVEEWYHASGATLWGEPRLDTSGAGSLVGKVAWLRVEGRPAMNSSRMREILQSLR